MPRFFDAPTSRDREPLLITGARLLDPAATIDAVHDVLVDAKGVQIDPRDVPRAARRLDAAGLWLLPGLIDLQVHFRQPGFEHKETLATGSRAALAGGVTTCVVMPNTKPSLDNAEAVRSQGEEARRVGAVRILVAAAVTQGLGGEAITDHGGLAAAGAVAVTDDGLPVMSAELMAQSLAACAEHDLLFMQHAEDISITHHRPMTEGPTSRALGVEGQPADAEGVMVERDVRLAREAGARYHVLHTSTARSVAAVREAKSAGAAVSCEASPHHLLLTDEACARAPGGDPNTKMNPPLRREADRQALIAALADGTVDAIATDHAPHAAEEKAKGFVDAPFGVIGLETAFATALAFMHDKTIDSRRAVELMTAGPARVLRQSTRLGTLASDEAVSDLCLVDPEQRWTVGDDTLFGRSKNSAFGGHEFRGRVVATVLDGALRYLTRESLLA
ncbi:MAG: dihydroorotase [Proteobacteria bacterium]|nr:MAG: dihydroorotase [Pseudomonadota bacterium]